MRYSKEIAIFFEYIKCKDLYIYIRIFISVLVMIAIELESIE